MTSDMRERVESEITISDMSNSVFSAALEWIYTGTCQVSEAALWDILEGADRLQVKSLAAASSQALEGRIVPENVIFRRRVTTPPA